MLLITDLQGNTEALVSVTSLKRVRAVNGERSLTFTAFLQDIDAFGYEALQGESVVEFEGERYVVRDVHEEALGEGRMKEVTCLHEFFVRMLDSWVYTTQTATLSLTSALNTVFNGTGYTFQIIGTYSNKEFENFGDDTRSALFQNVLNRWGLEFELSGSLVRVMQQVGPDTDYQLRYNHNLAALSYDEDWSDLTTYVKGFGKPLSDGTYEVQGEYFAPTVSLYGIKHAKPVRDERITTLSTLNAAMEAAVSPYPIITIELDLVVLQQESGYDASPAEGARLLLVHEPLGLDLVTRVMQITDTFMWRDGLFQVIDTELTLANLKKDITDVQAQFSATKKQVDKVFTASGSVNTGVLDTDVKAAVQQMQQITSELLAQGGLRAISRTDANRRVVFTAEGIGTSTDAGATYEEALTAEGVNLANSYGDLPIERVDGLQASLNGVYGRVDALELIDAGTRLTNLEDEQGARLESARGTTLERPTLTTMDEGFIYYDRDLLKLILWKGTAWTNLDGTTL